MRKVKFGIVAVGLIAGSFVNAQEHGNGDKLFAKLDANSDGLISKSEFTEGRENKTNKAGEPIDFDTHFTKRDVNSDGNIDRTEFDAARAERAEIGGLDHFSKMDTDHNGLISKAEFAAKKEGKTNKEGEPIDIDKRFAKLDANSDGNIDKIEFEAAKKKHAEKKQTGDAVK